MPASKIPLLTLSILATATIAEEQAVGHDGAVASAAGKMLGLAISEAPSGTQVGVDTLGTSIAVAGAAIANGADLQVGSSGKLVTQTAGIIVARALQAAAADGDKLEVLLLP